MIRRQRREQVPFNMAIGKVELVLQCFPKHSRMGTANNRIRQSNRRKWVIQSATTLGIKDEEIIKKRKKGSQEECGKKESEHEINKSMTQLRTRKYQRTLGGGGGGAVAVP